MTAAGWPKGGTTHLNKKLHSRARTLWLLPLLLLGVLAVTVTAVRHRPSRETRASTAPSSDVIRSDLSLFRLNGSPWVGGGLAGSEEKGDWAPLSTLSQLDPSGKTSGRLR